jgi:alpha-tubulin suppressor-like RCC1 family protein
MNSKGLTKVLAVFFVFSMIIGLGIGSELGSKVAYAAFDPALDIPFMSCGEYHSMLLSDDGTVRVTGYNGYGQLGLGDTVSRNSPTKISGLYNVKQVFSGKGSFSSFAILNDGSVKAWGYNSSGELGLGDTNSRLSPTLIPGLSGVKQIASGLGFTLALMNDGTVKSWGDNSNGKLGLGDTVSRYTPTTIPNLSGVKQITAGFTYAQALMTDGTVKSWGFWSNNGLNVSYDTLSPTTISGLTGVKQLEAANRSSIALKTDGTVKHICSGTSPDSLSSLTNVKQVAATDNTFFALMNNGV